MAIEVRIPTILRTYTGGDKAVSGAGATLTALLDDLDSRHTGLRGRLVTDEGALHRFVNVYVNDEDVRFLGGLDTKLTDGDSVTVLPAATPVTAGVLATGEVAVTVGATPRPGGPRIGSSPPPPQAARKAGASATSSAAL